MKLNSFHLICGILLQSCILSCASCTKDNNINSSDNKDSEQNPTMYNTYNIKDDGNTYDWSDYYVPVKTYRDTVWVLQSQSDEFNYTSSFPELNDIFTNKWIDYYHANWNGPGITTWRRDHIYVSNGSLNIKASRIEGETENITLNGETKTYPVTRLGCITSKNKVKYPVYIEAYAKISNSTLASDVWMLSDDDTQEIDILEAYGGDRNIDENGKEMYGADRLHLSHHVFIRDPFTDYQPQDAGSWYKDGKNTLWRDDYHRIGVYWKNPTHLEYYVDGKLVRTVDGMDIIDPKGYTGGTGLNKELNIIINMEDQTWRTFRGMSPTSQELQDTDKVTMHVDWIRIYKPEKN